MRTISVLGLAAAAITAAFFARALLPAQSETAPAAKEPDLFPFIRSLEGTVPDGMVRVDSHEHLVVTADLPHLFDYYLSGIGERPLEAIRAEIEREIDVRYKAQAAAEARVLLTQYLSFKQALVDLEKNPQIAGATVQAMRARMAAMRQLRAQFFTPAQAQAMFGEEDAQHEDAIARLAISQNPDLNGEQKAQRLAALDVALPASLREGRDASLQVVRLEQEAQDLRGRGASEDDVYRMRAATLSPEAASRMAEVDREEAAWKSRIGAYLAERNRLQAAIAGSAAPEREAALQQLRQTHFNEDEERRLAAYE